MARAAKPEDTEDNAEEFDTRKIVQDELAALSGKSLEEVLQEGHEALLRLLVAKVRTGTASHQEQAVLRNILRDNGMVIAVPPMKTIDGELAPPLNLPQLAPPDYD